MASAARTGLIAVLGAAAIAAAALTLFRPPAGPSLQLVGGPGTSGAKSGGPAMCPWRDPHGDMTRFFPGATSYEQETLVLSRHRPEILRRLGPGYHMETTALYAYRARRGAETLGTVLVRRAAGEYGALEIVAAVDLAGKLAGVRLQRHREPKEIGEALTAPSWLGAFKGKGADDPLRVGQGLPDVPQAARKDADVVADGVRALLVEYTVAQNALKPLAAPPAPEKQHH